MPTDPAEEGNSLEEAVSSQVLTTKATVRLDPSL